MYVDTTMAQVSDDDAPCALLTPKEEEARERVPTVAIYFIRGPVLYVQVYRSRVYIYTAAHVTMSVFVAGPATSAGIISFMPCVLGKRGERNRAATGTAVFFLQQE